MLKAIAIILGNGFEIALVVSVIIIWLRHMENGQYSRWVFGGAGFAGFVGWIVLYSLKWSGPKKESFTGWVMGICILMEILFLIWVRKERKARPEAEGTKNSQSNRNTVKIIFIFLTAAFLTVLPLMRILLFPSSIFIQTYSVVNTELVLKFTGGLIGLIFCFQLLA